MTISNTHQKMQMLSIAYARVVSSKCVTSSFIRSAIS